MKPKLWERLKIELFDPDTAKGGITYTIAKGFCDLMNKTLELMGFEASLPTSIQWEYACRAGCRSSLNNGTEITRKTGRCWNLGEIAWNPLDKVDHPQSVGKKAPNNWGIYDMNGNVWEWCLDPYIHINKKGIIEGPEENTFIVRGGSFKTYPKFCRSACIQRMFDYSGNNDTFCRLMYANYGFRIVLNKK